MNKRMNSAADRKYVKCVKTLDYAARKEALIQNKHLVSLVESYAVKVAL